MSKQAMRMNIWEAKAKAAKLWTRGYAVVRRKSTNVQNREVGYYDQDSARFVVKGRGTTWEEAFAAVSGAP